MNSFLNAIRPDAAAWHAGALVVSALLILSCGLVVVTFIDWRFLRLREKFVVPPLQRKAILTAITHSEWAEALSACASANSPLARVLLPAINERKRYEERGRAALTMLVEKSAEKEVRSLSMGLTRLGAIAFSAPLLGLLGTVLGMLEAFATIETIVGAPSPQLIASGITAALFTTVLGLAATLAAYWAGRVLQRRRDQLIGQLEEVAEEAVDLCTLTAVKVG